MSNKPKQENPRKETPYNPLDKRHLGESVAKSLLEKKEEKLPPENKFSGSGIYAIYYGGSFELYSPISKQNLSAENPWSRPIYVGRAEPSGKRKGGSDSEQLTDEEVDELLESQSQSQKNTKLYDRLKQHATSIEAAQNLALSDFRCKYLCVDDIWIPLGEALVIKKLRPLWNVVLEGFGNHAPGKGRKEMLRPYWDMLHPGRKWAESLTPRDSRKDIEDKVLAELSKYSLQIPKKSS